MDYNKIKKQLSDAVKIKTDKENAKMRERLMETVGADIASSLAPLLAEMAGQSAGNSEVLIDKLVNALKNLKIQVPDINPKIEVNVPDINIPQIELPIINVPQPRVNVNVPDVIVPELKMPTEMNVRGMVSLEGINLQNPLPVQLRDENGKPLNILGNLTQIVGGGGSGARTDFFTIKGFTQSAFAEFMNPDGRVKVEMPAGASGLTDIELRASSVPVEQVSGSMWSVYVAGSTGTIGATILDSSGVQYSGSNPLPVVITSGAAATTAVQNLDGDGLYRGTFPVEGTVAVSGITNSVAAVILDAEGNYRDSFPVTGTFWQATQPVSGTVAVSGITNSVASALIDSSGVQYSTSNPLPIDDAGGSLTIDGTVVVSSITASTTAIIGDKRADEADGDSNPVKIGGVARTANPTAVANGDRVSATYDDIGRQLIRPVQVRDLIKTAYVTEDEIQEVALLAGVASTYHDLIYVMCANESTGAINLDFRQTTGGTVQMSVEVPANGTAGVSLPVPIPQDHADATWTVKNSASDNSNTVYSVTALFSKEV